MGFLEEEEKEEAITLYLEQVPITKIVKVLCKKYNKEITYNMVYNILNLRDDETFNSQRPEKIAYELCGAPIGQQGLRLYKYFIDLAKEYPKLSPMRLIEKGILLGLIENLPVKNENFS